MVEKNNCGHPILNEQNIIELIYQDKWSNIKDCLVKHQCFAHDYNEHVTANKDPFDLLNIDYGEELGQDAYDQENRSNWFMPDEYKNMDIEEFLVNACPEENYERLVTELDLYKSHAMMDVLKFLKYMVDTLRKNNIVWGVGRGSSVASYVLYLIGVHKIDSVKYNLDPTEFLR